MKIALVIPGRFHGFDLAHALLARGHDVTVLTNYPRWATRRFGLPDAQVMSFGSHGIASRALARMAGSAAEAALHRAFGRWAARRLAADVWDVIHGWTGVSEEWLASPNVHRRLSLLMRGSAHIDAQAELLADEARRAGHPIDSPSEWMRARERREYAGADAVAVLSSFARDTFLARGAPPERVWLLPPGVDVESFQLTREEADERRDRILDGAPLRVLFVGTVSLRKGMLDLADAVERLPTGAFDVDILGEVMREAEPIVRRLRGRATFHGRVPQADLPPYYRKADVFVFPTIEDGFAVVLAQAKAAGLPIVATPNCAAPDLLADGVDGWIVPIRDGEALADRLIGLAADRPTLAHAAALAATTHRPSDWTTAAEAFEAACEAWWSYTERPNETHV